MAVGRYGKLRWFVLLAAVERLQQTLGFGEEDAPVDEAMAKYSPKSCKYNLLPDHLESRAYTTFTGEVQVNDVFGLPSVVKKHSMYLKVKTASLLTLQAEVHRDTPATLSVDFYDGKRRIHSLVNEKTLGAGGDDTKVFIHGLLDKEKELDLHIVFTMASVELAASQVDSRVAEARCWPIRLDLAVIPNKRAAMHWAEHCPDKSRMPPPLSTKNGVAVLPDTGLSLDPSMPPLGDSHYVYRFGWERPFKGFGRALWSGLIEVAPRLHRFVRLFFRASFRFPSSPLQLIVELFDLTDNPDTTDLAPRCTLGCLGGVPVFNGQIINHAMPTGFRYRIWLLRAGMDEWMQELPSGRHCLEFDFDYSIKFEEGMTPFEVGPSAWLCESTRLPEMILQTKDSHNHKEIGDGEAVIGRNIWIRDRFGFPPDEVSEMEHQVVVQVAERSVFRATTHHSDGVDVFLQLHKDDAGHQTACRSVRHPGPVPRQTVFCILEPGLYKLTFFADYPLGGLHPCSDFFAQMALKPLALLGDTDACIRDSDVHPASSLVMSDQPQLHMEPNWQTIKVPIEVGTKSRIAQVWRQGIEVKDDVAAQKVFLRMVVYSDYASADMRFQVWLDGRWIADTQVTANGYADMIGPLDPGIYEVRLYYITAGGLKDDTASDNPKLCSAVSADLRLVSKVAYENNTDNWLCTSTRVPAPVSLEPQTDEQVLIDSEYVMPESVAHSMKITIKETRLLRVQATSADADFLLKIRSAEKTQQIAQTTTTMEVVLSAGSYLLLIIARVKNLGNAAACSTFLLNLLLQSESAIPQCPWSSAFSGPRSSKETTQGQAADHIGNLLLDLVPTELSTETAANIKKPTSLWMSEGMEKTFEFKVSQTSAIRLDIAMHPPFLPLQVTVSNKVAKTKLEAPVASGEWTENRLLLINSDLAPGSYILAIKQPKKYLNGPGVYNFDMRSLCSHVTISAEIGAASKEAINSMRSELLDLPDLLAVQPWLPSLNMVGWLSSGSSATAPIVGTQVYRFQNQVSSSKFTLDEKSIVRVVCEPADLSNSEIDAKLKKTDGSVVATSDSLGQLIAEAEPGSYELEMRPKASAPFLVTLGVATVSRLKEDIVFNADQDSCLKTVPAISAGAQFPESGWTIGPVFVRLDPKFLQQEGRLSKVPISLAAPSVLYIELGSSLPLDLVRISLEVPEGLWVAEQRGLRNSLEIELPSGQYTVHLGQPKAARLTQLQRCLDFSVLISAKPISPDSSADEKADESSEAAKAGTGDSANKELAAREEAAVEAAPCFSMGTVPMPLDLSDPNGGSPLLGGPIKDGRLLVRSKVMITDMHDGRKKMYLATEGKPLQMKVGVVLGGYSKLSLASSLSFRVTTSSGKEVPQTIHWATDAGWERVFVLDTGDKGYWLAFHHSHRERTESACLHFTLAIETHPLDELQRMMTCPSIGFRAEDKIPSSFDIASRQSSADPWRFFSPMWSCKQPQEGFLTKSKFTLTTQSWVSVEVQFNFFISHGEMDIVDQRNPSNSIAFGEFDFVHNGGHQLNSMLTVGRVLPPGDYLIRVADDHYEKQLDRMSGSACFPFSFEMVVVPEKAAPVVVAVQPDPTVPVHRGTDLVLTIRFSEPPAGTVEEVVSCMWLGPYQAKTGGSYHHMHSKYVAAQHVTTVQASAAEGHHVWVIAWSADVVKELNKATLRIVGLRSNATKQLFRFNPPTFIISEAGHVEPWSGGDKQGAGEPMAPGTPADGAAPPAATGSDGSSGSSGGSRAVGAPRPEGGAASQSSGDSGAGSASSSSVASSVWGGGSRSVATVGIPRSEGSSSGSSGSGSNSGTSADFPGLPQWEPKPNVEEWNPFGDDSKAPAKRDEEGCPEGTTLNKETSICETSAGSTRSLLSDSRVTTGAFAFSAIFLAAFCWPSIRKMVPSGGGSRSTPSARFRDIADRTDAEELGLVGNQDYDDDDML